MELSIPLYLRQHDAWQYQKSVEGKPSASRGLLQAHNSSHRQRFRIYGKPLNKVSKRRRGFRNHSYKSAIIRVVEKREIINPSPRTLMAVAISTDSPRSLQYLNDYSYIPTQIRLDKGWRYPSISLIPSTRARGHQHVSADASLGLKIAELEKRAVDDDSSILQGRSVEGSWSSPNELRNTFTSSRECPSPSTVEPVRLSGAISSATSEAVLISSFSEASSRQTFGFNLGFLSASAAETSTSIFDRRCLSERGNKKTPLHISALPKFKEEEKLASPELNSTISQLIEKLMKDFQIHMEQNLKSMGARHETPSSTNSHTATTAISEQGPTKIRPRKRPKLVTSHENENMSGDDDDGDDDRRNSKRSRAGSEKPGLKSQFACPFRKRDPRKYSVQDWRTCALGSFTDISRVKGHLFRKHLIYQCQRCKESFKTENALETHLQAVDACQLKDAEPVDGVTQKMEYQLRSRKKAYPGQTEPERWLQIYKILFPGETVPQDPYFNPVQDNKESTRNSSSETKDLATFEEYMREEIPCIVRTITEEQLNTGELLEKGVSGLRDKIITIVREAQEQAFSKYRAIHTSENSVTVAREPLSHYLGLTAIEQPSFVPEPLCEEEPHARLDNPWDFEHKINDNYDVEYATSFYDFVETTSKKAPELLRQHIHSVNIESSVSSSKIHPLTYGQTKASSAAPSSHEEPQPRQDYLPNATYTMELLPTSQGPKLAPLQLPEPKPAPEPATSRSDTDLTIKSLITSQPEVPNDQP